MFFIVKKMKNLRNKKLDLMEFNLKNIKKSRDLFGNSNENEHSYEKILKKVKNKKR